MTLKFTVKIKAVMLFLIFVTALLFVVDSHLKFTECQAEFYRKQPGNEDVVFETDGRPCQTEARGLSGNLKWNNVLQNGYNLT
jgi:hypothetical protein